MGSSEVTRKNKLATLPLRRDITLGEYPEGSDTARQTVMKVEDEQLCEVREIRIVRWYGRAF